MVEVEEVLDGRYPIYIACLLCSSIECANQTQYDSMFVVSSALVALRFLATCLLAVKGALVA